MNSFKMSSFKKTAALALTIALLVFSAACGQAAAVQDKIQGTAEGLKPVALTVSAASSLKDAMEEVKTAYESKRDNVTITYNFGSSGSLQQQIEQGAEVDVFVSAAEKQMDALNEKGLILEDTRKDFLENNIVLVVPAASSAVADFKDLSGEGVRQVALGDLKSVPAGQYAEEVLTSLGLLDSVRPKAVYGKDVKEVLTWVETGNADAGIVYETDALVSDKVKVAAKAPEGSHKPVYYPAAVIKAGKNTDAAREYINFLYGSEAKPIFEKYGFVFLIK